MTLDVCYCKRIQSLNVCVLILKVQERRTTLLLIWENIAKGTNWRENTTKDNDPSLAGEYLNIRVSRPDALQQLKETTEKKSKALCQLTDEQRATLVNYIYDQIEGKDMGFFIDD
ncbi:hypothetical protein CHS0354_028002 [Potamilus streckersoni]|uniref:Uncharacterized protein n=1 Tax=Potamilus streckersoni TaxID=2493646 RepID=A0AAE0T4Y3_9BIVA|nr:hypothetical protein CHS0354_028002 [Potamilus streckersoni]